MNPFLGAAWFFPKTGLLAFIFGGVLAVSIFFLVRHFKSSIGILTLVSLTVVVATLLSQHELPNPPAGWVGVDTQLGAFPESEFELFEHRKFVAITADQELRNGNTAIIFPETILGHWDDRTTGAFLAATLKSPLASYDAVVLAGAIFETSVKGQYQNSVIVLDGSSAKRLDSRQPIPVSMWKPWGGESVKANWTSTGVHQVAGKKIMLSFCYEDFVPLLSIISFLFDKPDVIVSVANGWWVQNTNEPAIQYRHIATISRIFDTPLIRALNR